MFCVWSIITFESLFLKVKHSKSSFYSLWNWHKSVGNFEDGELFNHSVDRSGWIKMLCLENFKRKLRKIQFYCMIEHPCDWIKVDSTLSCRWCCGKKYPALGVSSTLSLFRQRMLISHKQHVSMSFYLKTNVCFSASLDTPVLLTKINLLRKCFCWIFSLGLQFKW